MASVRLVVCDMDGCLSQDKGFPFDLARMAELKQFLTRSKIPFALGTGRSDPYVEAMTQVLNLTTPSLCEHGCYVYDPQIGYPVAHRALTPHLRRQMTNLRRVIEDHSDELDCFLETKLTCLSVHPRKLGASRTSALTKLQSDLAKLLDSSGPTDWLRVNPSSCCVDLVPACCDKGAGVLELCHRLSINPEDTLAIGDSPIDLPMMAVCGHSATPANGLPSVKAKAHFIAQTPDIQGVLEILNHYIN